MQNRGYSVSVNSSTPGQNCHHLADDDFKRIFMNEKVFFISIRISFRLVPRGPNDNKAAIVQVNGSAPDRRPAITWTNADPVKSGAKFGPVSETVLL